MGLQAARREEYQEFDETRIRSQVQRWSRSSSIDDGTMDRGVLIGGSICIALLVIGLVFSGSVRQYFDFGSFALIIGGTLGATLIHFSWVDVEQAFRLLRKTLFTRSVSPSNRANDLLRYSQSAREEGVLVLEREARACDDAFLRNGLEMVADGRDQADMKRMLETEVATSADQYQRASQLFQTMGGYAPAMGLIGTLIGLIQMLSNLKDPGTVGPAMSLALVATLYGSVTANLICLPISGKLRIRNEEEHFLKAVTLEGLLSIGRQESPVVLEQRLQGFLSKHP